MKYKRHLDDYTYQFGHFYFSTLLSLSVEYKLCVVPTVGYAMGKNY